MGQETILIQATAVFYDGCCFLIIGESGIGKTSLALSFLEQGGLLISDDVVYLKKEAGELIAFAPPSIYRQIEIRPFGVVALDKVCEEAPVRVVFELIEKEPERVQQPISYCSYLGTKIPFFQLRGHDFSLTMRVKTAIKMIKDKSGIFDVEDLK